MWRLGAVDGLPGGVDLGDRQVAERVGTDGAVGGFGEVANGDRDEGVRHGVAPQLFALRSVARRPSVSMAIATTPHLDGVPGVGRRPRAVGRPDRTFMQRRT